MFVTVSKVSRTSAHYPRDEIDPFRWLIVSNARGIATAFYSHLSSQLVPEVSTPATAPVSRQYRRSTVKTATLRSLAGWRCCGGRVPPRPPLRRLRSGARALFGAAAVLERAQSLYLEYSGGVTVVVVRRDSGAGDDELILLKQ